MQGLPKFLVSPIISGMGKATNFKFCTYKIDRTRPTNPSEDNSVVNTPSWTESGVAS